MSLDDPLILYVVISIATSVVGSIIAYLVYELARSARRDKAGRIGGAWVINIGTEVAEGRIRNENGEWLARQLSRVGLKVLNVSVVHVDEDVIRDEVRRAMDSKDVGLIVTTGGLSWDTRDRVVGAVREAVGDADEEALLNPVGSAPGVLLRAKGKTIIMLPGVPSEMKKMYKMYVLMEINKMAKR